MNLAEYDKIKNFTYLEYCDYLQNKYGIGLGNYMSKTFKSYGKKYSRTADGLWTHHKFEDHASELSVRKVAAKYPYEWQLPENLVYCDNLEHLLLHILICEYPSDDRDKNDIVGFGGIIDFIVPLLNDIYSGWEPLEQWQKNCRNAIINDKDVYLTLLKRLKKICKKYSVQMKDLCKGAIQSPKQNQKLYEEIIKL